MTKVFLEGNGSTEPCHQRRTIFNLRPKNVLMPLLHSEKNVGAHPAIQPGAEADHTMRRYLRGAGA